MAGFIKSCYGWIFQFGQSTSRANFMDDSIQVNKLPYNWNRGHVNIFLFYVEPQYPPQTLSANINMLPVSLLICTLLQSLVFCCVEASFFFVVLLQEKRSHVVDKLFAYVFRSKNFVAVQHRNWRHVLISAGTEVLEILTLSCCDKIEALQSWSCHLYVPDLVWLSILRV